MHVPTNLRMAWRNLGRNPKRTTLAVLAIGVAQLALIFTDAIMHGYGDSMIDAVTGPLIGHVQVHAPGWRRDRDMDLVIDGVSKKLQAIRQVEGVETASARIYAPALGALSEEGHVVLVIGVDPTIEGRPGGLLAGVPADHLPSGHRVVLGSALADNMGAKVGDTVAIVGQAADGSIANDLYTVGDVLTSIVGDVQQSGVVMSLAAAQELVAMPDAAHEITVRGVDPAQAPALSARIAALPELAGEEVLPWEKIVPELLLLVRVIDRSSLIVVLLVFIASAAGIANTMVMATFERTREIGMLLAFGASPGRIVRTIVEEAMLLGLLGVVLGTALGALVVAWTSHSGIDLTTFGNDAARELSFQGLTYQFDITPRVKASDVLEGMGGVLFTSVFASLGPAIRSSRLQPVEAMRS